MRGHDDTIETEWCTIDGVACFYATRPTIKTCRAAGDTAAAHIR